MLQDKEIARTCGIIFHLSADSHDTKSQKWPSTTLGLWGVDTIHFYPRELINHCHSSPHLLPQNVLYLRFCHLGRQVPLSKGFQAVNSGDAKTHLVLVVKSGIEQKILESLSI